MKQSSKQFDFAVGGQAIIEGVMMRSPHFYTISVRDPEGQIQMKQAPFESITKRVKWLGWPLIRGVVNFVESMKISFRALDYSNAIFLGEDEEEVAAKKAKRGPVMRLLFGILALLFVLLNIAIPILLLKFLPLWVAGKAAEFWPYVAEHYLLFNTIDGVTKISIFVGYIAAISLLKDMRRVFQYHGAEHKSIWAYEKGLDLTVANARKQTRFHPRCGTSFIVIVIVMSILVYTVIPPAESFWFMLLQRVAVVPLIAGISYELLQGSAKFQEHALMRVLMRPGLWVQILSTREPDDDQLEIALHSLKESLRVETDLKPV